MSQQPAIPPILNKSTPSTHTHSLPHFSRYIFYGNCDTAMGDTGGRNQPPVVVVAPHAPTKIAKIIKVPCRGWGMWGWRGVGADSWYDKGTMACLSNNARQRFVETHTDTHTTLMSAATDSRVSLSLQPSRSLSPH